MSTLYELTGNLQELQYLLENPECEVSEECLRDTLEGIEGAFEDKINAYCKIIKNIKADEEALKTEIQRLQAKKKAKENAEIRLKESIAAALVAVGKDKIKTPLFSLYGLKADKLIITGNVTGEYKKEVVRSENDNEKIKNDLISGKELPFARLGMSVTVR